MSDISSGCYIVDQDFNVVGVNDSAHSIYPQLKVGEKCYKCLMNIDSPCDVCPIINKKMGPNMYIDPIRNITEIVDAVEIPLEGHGTCHGLTFSTVGNLASFAATLPTTSSELQELALVGALTVDYYDVFSVDLETENITLYRHNGKQMDSTFKKKPISYKEEMESYIMQYVLKEDKDMMRERNNLNYIKEKLKMSESFVVHYQVLFQNEIHYFFRKISRVGNADSFKNIVVGVGCEDDLIISRNKYKEIEQNLNEIEIDSRAGLYTRESFMIHATKLLKENPDKKFDFCIMRIDHLSSINHQYGRTSVNKLIRLVGKLLKEYDDEFTCLGYFGDGMFVSFTENIPEDIRKSNVLGFRDKILEYSEIKSIELKWSIYVDAKRELSVDDIIEYAEYALSTIRTNMHEDYVEFDQSILNQMEWEKYVEIYFKKALEQKEFVAWYQPKYSVKTGKIIGAEALVRWQRPNKDMVPPFRFIPILERNGKVNQLDAYIFEETCKLQSKLEEKVPISVNLSRASMFTTNIANKYFEITSKYQVDPSLVPIEITESAAIRALAIQNFANDLISKGFVLHMDDFGAGYSSLASLFAIPFETIKLDKSLIDYIGNENSEAMLKHTIAFAKETGKKVIAEGVENFEQFMFLKIAGCDGIQGYYFSKPVPEEEFLKLLEAQKGQ